VRIRNLREDSDLTQAQVTAVLNIHQTTYSDYELGRTDARNPPHASSRGRVVGASHRLFAVLEARLRVELLAERGG
jgi:transcriptional regulator with XRE-family HTH domain